MKRLDDISKKNIFEVPDGYFDKLALQIQSKTEKTNYVSKQWITRSFSLKYVAPAFIIVFALIYFFKAEEVQSPEEILASVPTEHLAAYLSDSDLNMYDLLSVIKFDEADADSLSKRVHSKFDLNESDINEYKRILEYEL
ncbi:MAG: hypothetical protein JST48_14710 [Bacteroidetes bacterium]|nr:hypothetical protein [Bacteroidota bacterium]